MLLYGLALTASFADSFIGRPNVVFSNRTADWPVLSSIRQMRNSQAGSFISYIHTSAQSFNRQMAHSWVIRWLGGWPLGVSWCILLRGLSPNASFGDSFVDRVNGVYSKWASDWPIVRWFIGWIIDSGIHPPIHSYVPPVHRSKLGPFVEDSLIDGSIPWWIIDLVLYYAT